MLRIHNIPLNILLFLILIFQAPLTIAFHSGEEWKSRTIYQIITDRFAPTKGMSNCKNLKEYCGGTFKGITKNLDYIKELGFNAIWISPIVSNTPGGYHGYWTQNFYSINNHFGTEADLLQLVEESHKRDIWVMVDVVLNHVGDVDTNYHKIIPFNQANHYHTKCHIKDWGNQREVEYCRLANLPDLSQENEYVSKTLIKYIYIYIYYRWVIGLIGFYNLDGLRVDTVKHVPKEFWSELRMELGGIYALGEVWHDNLGYIASYTPYFPGLLNYPIYNSLIHAFREHRPLNELSTTINGVKGVLKDVSTMGLFVDNHDNPRFLHSKYDLPMYKNAQIFCMFGEGIPIIYYGAERGFHGGRDPANREPMWGGTYIGYSNTKYTADGILAKFFILSNEVRKKYTIWEFPPQERVVGIYIYIFQRGPVFVCLTNNAQGVITGEVNVLGEFEEGSVFVNWLDKTDFVPVVNGLLSIKLVLGEPKIYVYQSEEEVLNNMMMRSAASAPQKVVAYTDTSLAIGCFLLFILVAWYLLKSYPENRGK